MKIRMSFLLVTLLVATNANAQVCGMGRIVDMKEGGWNENGFGIRLAGPNADPVGSNKRHGTDNNYYVFFDPNTLSAARMEAIRRVASLAVAMGANVWTNSHTGACSNATEISILP